MTTGFRDDVRSAPRPVLVRASDRGDGALSLAATLVVAAAAGALMRIWILASPLGATDSDEAVVGLMARHLLHGHASPFYWGQPYGGTQEPAVVAGLFALVGSGPLAMKLIPIVFSILAAFLVWRIGLRTVGTRGAAIAAVIFWSAPTAFVWLSTKERGFYGTTVVLGLLVVLMALRLRERASWRDAAVIGLAGGSGWWASPMIMYLVLPSLVWLTTSAWRERRADLLRLSWVAALGSLIGAAPWLMANVHSHWASLSIPTMPVETTYLDRLELFFKTGLPIVLGLKVPYGGHWVIAGAATVLYVLALGGFVYVISKRHGTSALLVMTAGAYPLLVALPPTSFYQIEPRYSFFLWPILALLLARLFTTLDIRLQPVAVASVVALAALGTVSLMSWSEDHPRNYDLAAGDIDPLLRTLRAENVHNTFADYWVAYRINLETAEKVTAASLGFVRYMPYQDQVRSSFAPAYVLFAGSDPEKRLGPAFDQIDVPYRRLLSGQYAIYLPASNVLPEQVPVW